MFLPRPSSNQNTFPFLFPSLSPLMFNPSILSPPHLQSPLTFKNYFLSSSLPSSSHLPTPLSPLLFNPSLLSPPLLLSLPFNHYFPHLLASFLLSLQLVSRPFPSYKYFFHLCNSTLALPSPSPPSLFSQFSLLNVLSSPGLRSPTFLSSSNQQHPSLFSDRLLLLLQTNFRSPLTTSLQLPLLLQPPRPRPPSQKAEKERNAQCTSN